MSQLIQMRQRMKAVETIKKITHAMRLISMSAHTRLRNKKEAAAAYKQEVLNLFGRIQPLVPGWNHEALFPAISKEHLPLMILVGSQKGLCGTFNTSLFHFFDKHIHHNYQGSVQLITIGKKANDFIQKHHGKVVLHFSEFTSVTLPGIIDAIMNYIQAPTTKISSVSIISNYAKTFFVQRAQITALIPAALPTVEHEQQILEPYIWEQEPQTILSTINAMLIHTTLYDVLLDSLIAEQSARFIAMDNSTRNASNLLDAMKLQYNKTRQAKITRELTDLIGSFQ